MMQFSNEVLLGLIGLLGTIIAAWSYTSKRKSDTALVEAQAKLKEVEGRLAREKGDLVQMRLVTEMMKQQVTINQQLAQQSAEDREKWRSELLDKEKRDESNYRVLADALRDVGIMVTTEVKARSEELHGKIGKMQDETRSLIHWELVQAVESSQRQYGQRDIVKFITGGKAIPFPREHGYNFRKCKVTVRSQKGVNLFPAPLHTNQVAVGRLFDGDEVRIMWDVPFPEGWAAVNAEALGVQGWVYKEYIGVEDCVNEEALNPT